MSEAFIKALLPRRSVYQLGSGNLSISNSAIVDIVRAIVEHTPTAFNSQTTRAIVVFGDKSTKIWKKIAWDALASVAPAEVFKKQTAPKLELFGAAHGTILFFEDTDKIKALQEQFPRYAAKFPEWAGHTSGASQILTWSALALENIGGNLQHYSPLIDEGIAKEFDVPKNWHLTAQLVFGSVAAPVNAPEHLDPTTTVKVFE